MKKTVKAGVLTGLILAPAAVVSANDTGVANDGTQIEPIATVETGTVAVPYNAVAELDVDKVRIEELFKLDGKTTISDFATYQGLVDRVFLKDTPEHTLLSAKLTFLEEIQGLKTRAASLTNEIGLLKTTHPQLFDTVPDLVKERAAITQSFDKARGKLDEIVGKGTIYTTSSDFESEALQTVNIYLTTIQGFEGEFLKNAKTLDTYAQDIIKAEAFIYGGEVELKKPDGTPMTDENGDPKKENVYGYVADIVKYDELGLADSELNGESGLADPESKVESGSGDSEPKDELPPTEKFKQLVEEATKYYNEKMTANEKKIADSHVLADGRTVAAVMKQAKDDLANANKVNALLDDIKVMNEADFKKKVEAVIKAYDKLNPRQRALVTGYDSMIEGKEGTDGTTSEAGYKDVVDIINAINTLKNRKNTQEYRDLANKTNESYDHLPEKLKSYVLDSAILKAIIIDIGEVKKEGGIEDLIINIDSIEDIKAARDLYNSLPKEQQKLVINYKELQNFEKLGKTTIKLSDQIDVVEIVNTKTFASKIDKLNASYEKLSEDEKVLIENTPSLSRLKYLTPFANITGKYYALKTTSPSYKKDVQDLYTALTATNGELVDSLVAAKPEDITALVKLKEDLTEDVTKLKNQLDNAGTVVQNIIDAQAKTNKIDQLKAIQEARNAYNALSKEEQKLVTNLKTLTELEKVVKQPLAVIKTIEAADPENVSKFPSTAKSAVTAFEKLTATQKEYLSNDYTNRIADFKTYLAFVEQVKALKPSAAGFQEAYKAANSKYEDLTTKDDAWNSDLKTEMIAAVEAYKLTLDGHNTSITGGQGVQKMIEGLGSKYGQSFLDELVKIDAAYAALSPDAKKQVTNYKQFQNMKKDGTAALKVVDLINDDTIVNVNVADSNYVKKVEAALKAYEKLTSRQKGYVYNYNAYLEPNLPIYEVVKAINNLKPSAKTYIEDIANVRQMYNRLTPTNQRLLSPILYKIEGAETGLATVNEVMDLIDAARPGVEDYVQKLTAAREAYDKLARINSAYQKLVLNYKTLTEREKALKPVTTAIYQIKELEEILARPVINSNELVKKYNDAVKAYEKIPYESRELVYNREVLLSTFYPVAKTTEAIANIKPSSNTFAEDVKKAREWYDSLSESDKARVSNYRDLVAFENTVSGGADVDRLIRQIPTSSPTQYMQAIKEARAAYDALTANEKRAVTLYKELQNYEKGVKNVQAAIDAIDNLQYASNLVSAYDKATKALDKLTAEQRQMVPNMNKLRSVGPAIDVYKMIASLKPSNANYAGTVQAAYSAYNMLSSAEKQYVTNFATLQEAKNNLDSVQSVISKIAGISPTSRNYAQQVQEALAMYNSLPSAVRKLVTNYDVLKSSQKDADTVSKVRQLISEINPNASNFESKVKSARSAYDKLTTPQKRLVSNYFLLEDYEAQLNNSMFFF